MTDGIRNYLLSLAAVGFIDIIVQTVLPPGTGKRAAAAVCGLLIIFVVIRPLGDLNLDAISRAIAKIDVMETTSETAAEIDNQTIIAGIIKENTESYIWDKAVELGISPVRISAEVVCDGGYPYPSRVMFCGEYNEKERLQLSAWIESELAIDGNSQEWIWNKGNG